MVSEQLPIACRYVPYDQWFITHIDPTWKIRHLKQRIIAKCLNLPFDPRFIQKDITPNARSPSPITFAPDTSSSPIDLVSAEESAGADEGYEEDDEREHDLQVDAKFKLKSKSSSPIAISPSFHPRPHQQKQEQEPQITTHTYTLLRFSTCQILEEDFQIESYKIQPHELVELHSSFCPPTFAASVISPISMPSSPPPNVASFPQTKSTQKKKKTSSISTHQPDPLLLSLTTLPRHFPNLYIQPHWQGWVRSLRVVWRMQMVPPTDESPSVVDNADRRGRRSGESVEWREKWLVIHDGVVNICKNPTDSNPTRFPLSSLIALRGPEYLSHSFKKGDSIPQINPTDPSTSLRSSSYISLGSSATSKDILKQTDPPDKDPKRNTRNLKKPRKEGLFSTASSPSLRSLGQDRQRQPQRTSSYTPTTFKPKSSVLPLTAEDYAREKVEKEVESLKKWEDIAFSFTLGGKDKKNKGKEKDKEEDIRERELRRVLLVPAPHRTSHHREGSDKDHSRSKSVRDKDKIIPTSREEADQAGMKIICVKFRVQSTAAIGERDNVVGQDDASFPKTRYTSTGPSLALVAASATGGTKMKKTSTAPHVVFGPDVYVGDSQFENLHGRHQPQSQAVSTGSGRTTATAAGIDSTTTSPTSHSAGFNRNLLGGKERDDREHKTRDKRKFVDDDSALSSPPSAGATAEDGEFPAVVGWASGSRSTGIGGEEGYAEPSAPSSPTIARPTVVIPILSPATTALTSVSPDSQPDNNNQTHDHPDSDTSSSISISSPVFAHSPHESDLDDETLYGTVSHASSSMNRPRKGYRYGGYHAHAQMKKVSEMELDNRGVGKVAEVERDGGQSQQARSNQDEDREGWITLDMINDHAFNSILRILHRHSPPSLSSSFTHSQTTMDSSISLNVSNTSMLDPSEDLHDQTVPSNTDDNNSQYTASTATPPETRSKAIHPPILEYLSARAAANHSDRKPLCVALPYPEWRLEVVNRARRAGMREIGRPLDLALHGWGREFEEMATAARERKLERERELETEKRKRRRSAQSHVSTIKARNRRLSKVVGGSDADDDDDGSEDEEDAMGQTHLDSDSDEESDTEWLAWMTDLPRQFLVRQQSHLLRNAHQAFSSTDPLSSSSLVDDVGPVRLPRTQEEERILYADKMRQLEPSAISSVSQPYHPSSPTSSSFMDSLKQLPTLSSPSSFDSLNHNHSQHQQHHQRGSSSTRTPTPYHAFSSMDDLFIHHSRSQSRSLQHLGSHRNVGSVPEEGADPAAAAVTASSRHELHHSASMDQQHLSSRKMEVDSSHSHHHHHMGSTSTTREEFALGKPILTNEQIMQIESEVFSSPLPSHWTFPPIAMPSSPSSGSHTPSASTSTSTPRPPAASPPPVMVGANNASGEAKALSSSPSISAINRFTSADLTRWPRSFGGTSLSTPPSPSASVTVSPNSTSPPRSSVFGSLGRSPSLLSKMGSSSSGQEKERKGFLLKKRMSRDLGKDKEREGESATSSSSTAAAAASPKQRPKLLLSGLSSSSTTTTTSPFSQVSMPLENLPEIASPTAAAHNNNKPISSSARALLRRVRSGSSLRDEESSSTPTPTPTPTPAGMGIVAVSPEMEAAIAKGVQKKKKGPIDRIVRGFDSSLAFAEGR